MSAFETGTGAAGATGPTGPAGGGTELAYAERTSDASITATTEEGADIIVTAGAVALNGSQVVMVEFSCAAAKTPENAAGSGEQIYVTLFDAVDGGAAAIVGYLCRITMPDTVGDDITAPMRGAARLTPASGSHVYSARGLVSGGTGLLEGASGGSDYFPIFLRVTAVSV